MILKQISIIITVLFAISCSNTNKISEVNDKKIEGPEEIYIQGMENVYIENTISAEENFSKLIKLYPLSKEAIQAEIMMGFIDYLKMDYENSINKFNRIIRKYPSLKNIDYVYYMKAMCNYEQISHEDLDGEYNDLALFDFEQVIKRFPYSKYADDSRQKIILINSNKAAKHMSIGRFYLKQKKFTAALNRFKIVVEDYSMTKFTPEALHRMVEAYYEMGMKEESTKTASVLGYNYPDSKWYKYSYKLIKKIEKKESLVKKITNIF